MRTILFLCSSNYYRSRFAELLFNHLAELHGLEWRAESRALDIERGRRNKGPMSPWTYDALLKHGVTLEPQRFPLGVTAEDFARADLIIALYDTEHRPYFERDWAGELERVEFWGVPDVPEMQPPEALEMVAREVEGLVSELRVREVA